MNGFDVCGINLQEVSNFLRIRCLLDLVDKPIHPTAAAKVGIGALLSPFLIASANSAYSCPMFNPESTEETSVAVS